MKAVVVGKPGEVGPHQLESRLNPSDGAIVKRSQIKLMHADEMKTA